MRKSVGAAAERACVQLVDATLLTEDNAFHRYAKNLSFNFVAKH